MSRTPLPACPRKRAPLWYTFFALPAVNDPLPPELKFRENTAFLYTAATSELLQYTTAIYCTKYCALSGLNSFFVTSVARNKYSNTVNYHLSADSRPTNGQQSADCWQKLFAKGGKRLSADCRPTVGQLSANCWSTVDEQSADSSLGGAVLHFFPC